MSVYRHNAHPPEPNLPADWLRLWRSLACSVLLAVTLAWAALACGRTAQKPPPAPSQRYPYKPPQYAFDERPQVPVLCFRIWGTTMCWWVQQVQPREFVDVFVDAGCVNRSCDKHIWMRPIMLKRFWSKVRISTDSGCWEWTGLLNKNGYGLFRTPTQTMAHRASWELKNGPILGGLFVLHRCDNRPCVNPAHLFLGTHADNAMDRERKGRGRDSRGMSSGRARVTDDEVRTIRHLSEIGFTQCELAVMFRMSPTNVGSILRRRTWGHV